MNILAHAVFGDSTGKLLFGSVMKDFFKRQPKDLLPRRVKDGFKVHEDLDAFAKDFPPLRAFRVRLHQTVKAYADPIADICFDHILASEWDALFKTSLPSFVAEVNAIVKSSLNLVPDSARGIVTDMLDQETLLQYATTDGLVATLNRFAMRTNNPMMIIGGIPQILQETSMVRPTLLASIPEIRDHTRTFLETKIGCEGGLRLVWQDEVSSSWKEVVGRPVDRR